MLKAQNIWESIITLYTGNRELEQQVTYAKARLKGDKVERTIFGLPKPRAGKDGTRRKDGPDKDGPAKEKP